jgi:antitoxin YefM
MAIETTYTDARARLARLMDRVAEDREVVLIRRRGHSAVAMVAADELASLEETAHLLRSPRNARRLLTALRRALAGRGRRQTAASVRRELGLSDHA